MMCAHYCDVCVISDLMRADPNNVDAVYVKAMCFYYQDIQDKAKRFFTQALRMDPDHTKSRQAMKVFTSPPSHNTLFTCRRTSF